MHKNYDFTGRVGERNGVSSLMPEILQDQVTFGEAGRSAT